MIRDDDYQHIVSDLMALQRLLPGRTIAKFDLGEGEIHFTDVSVLTVTWHEDFIGFKLFEHPDPVTEDE